MAPKTFTGQLSSSVNLILTPYFITSSVCIPLGSWPRCVLHHFFSSSTGSILGSCYASFSLILNPWLVAASMTLTECSPCWSYRTHLWYCNPVLRTRGERPLQARGFAGVGVTKASGKLAHSHPYFLPLLEHSMLFPSWTEPVGTWFAVKGLIWWLWHPFLDLLSVLYAQGRLGGRGL